MIKLLIVVLILIIAMIIAPHLLGQHGYLIIQTTHYTMTTSIAIALIVLLLLAAVLVLLFGLLNKARHATIDGKHWFGGRHQRRANRQSEQALTHWFTGDYQQAEKLAARAAEQSRSPLLNYLLAAQSAAKNQQIQQAYHYLRMAEQQQNSFSLPLAIVRTQIQLANHDNQAAEQSVKRLLEYQPYHPQVLRLAEQAYLNTGNYAELLNLLPLMKKKQIYSTEQLASLEQNSYLGLMDKQIVQQGSQGLLQWWKEKPRKIRQLLDLQVALAYHLFHHGDDDNAQEVALTALKQHYDVRLIKLLPQLTSGTPDKLHQRLQQLLSQEARPELYRAQAQLFMKQGDWQTALEHFLKVIKKQPLAEDYLQLAQVYDHLQQATQAAYMRQKAVEMTIQTNPLTRAALPHL